MAEPLYINLVDYYLSFLIINKGNLLVVNKPLANRILIKYTLGPKIELAKKYASEKLYKELNELNDYRIKLAHWVTGKNPENSKFYIGIIKETKIDLNLEYLAGINHLAKSVFDQIFANL